MPSSMYTSNIDPSEALGMSGVVTFLSARDVPGQNKRLWFNNPEELFAEEEVRTFTTPIMPR